MSDSENNSPETEHTGYGADVLEVHQHKDDPFFSANLKVMHDLLTDEQRYYKMPTFCSSMPRHTVVGMRRELINWVREIISFRNSDFEVMAHCGQLVDRFVGRYHETAPNYQLIGATCLLMSSKMKEVHPVCVSEVISFTAHSVTTQDILNQELIVGSVLGWDLTTITALDFLKPITDFLPFPNTIKCILVESATLIFVKVWHIELLFNFLPSYLATACILYAIQLNVSKDFDRHAEAALSLIIQLLNLSVPILRQILQMLDSCFEDGTMDLKASLRMNCSNEEQEQQHSTFDSECTVPCRREDETDDHEDDDDDDDEQEDEEEGKNEHLYGEDEALVNTSLPLADSTRMSSNDASSPRYSAASSSSALSLQLGSMPPSSTTTSYYPANETSKNELAAEQFNREEDSPMYAKRNRLLDDVSRRRSAVPSTKVAVDGTFYLFSDLYMPKTGVCSNSSSNSSTPADVRDVVL